MMKSLWDKSKIKSKCKKILEAYNYNIERKLNIPMFVFIAMMTFVIVWGTVNGSEWLENAFRNILVSQNENPEQVFSKMRGFASGWSDTVWTMVTISASAIVFYYGSLSYKNFGIQNRRTISYTVGSFFIPLCIGLTVTLVVIMNYYFYINRFVEFYMISAYSMVMQGLIVILCIFETSNAHCFKIIIKVEKRQYKKLRHMIEHMGETEENKYHYELEKEKRAIIYHTDMAMKGEESMSKILSLVKEILFVPFSIKEVQKSALDLDNKTIYYYTYQNARYTLKHISDEHIDVGSQEYFSLLYENVKHACDTFRTETDSAVQKNNYIKLAVYLSALLHAVLPLSKIENRWQFAGYVIDAVINDESRKELMIGVLICSIAYLDYRKLLFSFQYDNGLSEAEKLQESVEMNEIESCLNSIDCWTEWSCDDDMIAELHAIMKIWLVGTTGEQGAYQVLFFSIMNSLRGLNDNRIISYLLYKRRENNP